LTAGSDLSGSVHDLPRFPVHTRIERFGPRERRKRALRFALPLVLLCLVVLPVPGLHLSIPFLLGAAVWFGRRRLRETEQIRELVGECPCGRGPQSYALPDRLALPLLLRCPACREFVKVESGGPPADANQTRRDVESAVESAPLFGAET
jgi:hypothetical protein